MQAFIASNHEPTSATIRQILLHQGHDCPAGNVLLTLGHSPTPEDYLAGRAVEWAHLVLTPQQAQSLARDLLRTEGRSPQMMGEEI